MKNEILKALASFTKSSIAALTSHSFFSRGLEYFSYGRVIAFTWFKNDTELVALVRGSTTTYQVKISYDEDEDELKNFCNCPAWNPYNHCKHFICAILTASNILNDQPVPGLVAATLKMQLLSGEAGHLSTREKNDSYNNGLLTLHLKPVREMFSSSTSCEIALFLGKKEVRVHASIVPSSYCPFLYKNIESTQRDKLFREALSDHKITTPIVVHTPQGQINVVYDKALADAITELNCVDDYVAIRRLALLKGQSEPLHDIIQIGERLIVDVELKKIVILNSGNRWNWAQHVISQPRSKSPVFPVISEPMMVSMESFNSMHRLKYNDEYSIQHHFIFKYNGKTVVPSLIQPTLVIEGRIDTQRSIIRLNPQILINKCPVPLDAQLHNYLTPSSFPAWLHTKSRRALLNKAIFSLIGMHDFDTAKKYIHTIKEELCTSYKGHDGGSEIMYYLERFVDSLFEKKYEQIVVADATFYRVALDYYYLWRPYQILSNFFSDFYQYESPYSSSFNVPLEFFFTSLAALEQAALNANIFVRVNNKQIKIAALDVHIDASRSTSGDWFTLAPELLSHGVSLTRDQRDLVFGDGDNSGMIETDECITLFDSQTREIMKLLIKIFASQGTTGAATKQEIAQLPRLRILDLLELRKRGARLTLTPEDERVLEGLSNFSNIEKISVPKNFTGKLREYQCIGYRWLAFLYKHQFGGCLADDMGLGKTVQAIAFLGGIAEGIIENRCPQKLPHLIVVPPTLLFNWQHELQIFYSALRVKLYAGAGRTRTFDACDVILTTYDTVRVDSEYFKALSFHVIILDEAQVIKNIQSARTAAVRQLKSVFTLSLTGTPLENHIGEYYSIIDVALPGLLPDYAQFMKLARKEEHENLIKKMNVFVLRRTKDAILKELPQKVESNVMLAMTDKQQKVYATTVKEVKRMIEHAYTTKAGPQAHIVALTAILRLRQICISPQLIDKNSFDDAPKVDYLIQTLTEIVQEGAAALVFSQFIGCLDLIEQMLKKAELTYYRIDGSIPITQRKKIIESFQLNTDGVPILLLSLKTGGVGLNLTRANYVFHVDPWWNPAVENQASDRAHRIGQSKTVFVTRLVMYQTIEEKMMGLKAAKQKLFQDVMENAENKKASLMSKKDFDLLLT